MKLSIIGAEFNLLSTKYPFLLLAHFQTIKKPLFSAYK